MVQRRLSFSMPKNGVSAVGSFESMFELKEVQNTIKYDWADLLRDDANPIETAMYLLDDSSVGLAHKKQEFDMIRSNTENALRAVVNDHHEVFNNSIGSFHLLLDTLQDSQSDSNDIKDILESTVRDVQDRSEALREYSQTSARYSELIEILDAITEVSSIPNKIDQLTQERKIHEVYDVISQGYKTAEKYNLWSLSAMSATKDALQTQSNQLFDTIVEELQSEVYLKGAVTITNRSQQNVYSWSTLSKSNNPKLSSLKSLITESTNLEQYVHNSANLDITEVTDVLTEPVETFLKTQLPKIHNHYVNNEGQLNYSILVDSTMNLNSGSFHYIYMLLHTASRLGKLNQIVEILIGRHQSEVHGLLNRITEEVKQKNASALAKLAKLQKFDHNSEISIIGQNNFSDSSVVVLQDLFGSIFVKFLAVFQRHKIIGEIVNLIESGSKLNGTTKLVTKYDQENTASATNHYDLTTVWNILKKELKNVMLNYIIIDNSSQVDTADFLKARSKTRVYENRSVKNIFHFEDVSYERSTPSNPDFSNVLQNMFPGFNLHDSSDAKSNLIDSSSPYIQNETINALVEVLVPKNLFNMRIMLEFFLIFIEGSQRLFLNFKTEQQISGPQNKTALQFFDDFMKVSFLSHVKESLDLSFKGFVGGTVIRAEHDQSGASHFTGLKLDLISIKQNTTSNVIFSSLQDSNEYNTLTVYENALNFKKLFLSICSILNTSLTYRKEFSDTALGFLENFATSYSNFYLELLSTGNFQLNDYGNSIDSGNKPISKISKWMKIPVLTEVSGAVLRANAINAEDLGSLVAQESQAMLMEHDNGANTFNVNKEDVLDKESFNQVCNLLLTASWILTWLPSIKRESKYDVYEADQEEDESIRLSVVEKLRYNWSFLENGKSLVNITGGNEDVTQPNIFLALTPDKIQKFDELVQTFESIRDQTLLALRYDLRCKSIYYIGKSFRDVDWTPITEPGDSDNFVASLNQEVFSIDNSLRKVLTQDERDSIFVGIQYFLNRLLIQGSKTLKKINSNGIKRILLNIYTLNQMLRNLLKDPESIDFTLSSAYYDLFVANEFDFINTVKQKKNEYTVEEFKNLARLVYSEKLADGTGTTFNKNKYADLIKKIDEAVK
ncbi:Sec8 exocyst complex component-specific domain-containing protein [Scheffersomyces coipomensis]|uniref:Sec8 exocyst complex component-specific domain-containing protein n=1 Tax=Scheffersomyces coipomensis TaxID=1788519 RepID=UPI00315DF66D